MKNIKDGLNGFQYRTVYYRALTQGQLSVEIVKNIRTAIITKGTLEFSYIGKEEGQWILKKGSIVLKQMQTPRYAIDYLKGLTQEAVPEDILKRIDRILISGRYLTYRYKVNGKPLFGRVELQGVA